MAEQRTQTRDRQEPAPAKLTKDQQITTYVPPRIPFHERATEFYGIDEGMWQTLVDAICPSARTVNGVLLYLDYCKRRNLDPFKKPAHVVPIWDSIKKQEVEGIWPGINELRTTAFRTNEYAGCDDTELGPEIEVEFWDKPQAQQSDDHPNAPPAEDRVKPKDEGPRLVGKMKVVAWAQVTVYRLTKGQRFAYVGPRVYWEEAYATKSRWTSLPNEMWNDRKIGQLDKCAEAAALRKAFPEELGGEYALEEMGFWSRNEQTRAMRDITPKDEPKPIQAATSTEARPRKEDFEQKGKKDEGHAGKQRKPADGATQRGGGDERAPAGANAARNGGEADARAKPGPDDRGDARASEGDGERTRDSARPSGGRAQERHPNAPPEDDDENRAVYSDALTALLDEVKEATTPITLDRVLKESDLKDDEMVVLMQAAKEKRREFR